MEGNIKQEENVDWGGVCIINKNYEVIYLDTGMKNMFPNCQTHSQCYESFRGNKEACPDCPLKQLDHNLRTSANRLLYYKPLNGWGNCMTVSMVCPDEGETFLVSLKRVVPDQRHLSLNIQHNMQYESLIEFDIQQQTYTVLYGEEDFKHYAMNSDMNTLIEKMCQLYVHPQDQSAFLKFWDFVKFPEMALAHETYMQEFRILHKNDVYQWTLFYISPVMTEGKQTYYCFTICNEQSHHQEDEIAPLSSMMNPLTNIYNMRAFQLLVKQKLQDNPNQAYGIVQVDIEHFKLFNEWYGVNEGDKLLCFLADKFKKKADQCGGVAAHMGGDDFLILLPKEYCIAQEIQKEMIDYMQMYDPKMKFLPNGGIYFIQDRTLPVSVMCDCAQLALNSAKDNYTTRVGLYDEAMKQKLANKQEILSGVKQGLVKKEFKVYYQPQYNVRTSKVVGAEALVRWQHPEKGMISPMNFIPLLESSGFITQLDLYVWDEVCQFIHQRLQQGQLIVPISVNVSRMDIYQFDLTEVFQNLISKYNLHPRMIEIEITESAYAEDYQRLIEEVHKLRKAGFIVLMDDFGSGYSSFNMLKDIEIDILKLDMKFLQIDNNDHTSKSASILRSIMQMAKWLGLRMIVEGVETKEQVEYLKLLDFEFMQGYYFYRPMNTSAFVDLLDYAGNIDVRGIFAKQMPKIDLEDLFHKDITSSVMLNNIIGGIAVYEIVDDDHIEIKQVNESYYRTTGCNAIDLFERSTTIERQVPDEDLPILWDIFNRAQISIDTGAAGVFRRYRWNEELMWMHLHVYFLRQEGNRKIFYGNVRDYTKIMEVQKDMLTLKETMPGDIVEIKVKENQVISRRVICAGLYKLHGYDKEEYEKMLVSHGNRLIAPEQCEEVLNFMRRPEFWNKQNRIDIKTISKSGERLWLEQELHYIRTEHGVDIYNTLCIDVTRNRMRERKLKESEQILHDVLGYTEKEVSSGLISSKINNPQNIALMNDLQSGMIGYYCQEGLPLYLANEEILSMLGYDSYEELYQNVGGQFIHVIHKEDQSRIVENLQKSLTLGEEFTMNYRVLRKDQSWVWVIDQGRMMKTETGELAVLSTYIDISDIIHIKWLYNQSQQELDIIRKVSHGVIMTCHYDPEFNLIDIDQPLLDFLGFTQLEMENKCQNQFIQLIAPEDRNAFYEEANSFERDGQVKTWTFRLLGDKGARWVCCRALLITQNKKRYLIGNLLDVQNNHELMLENEFLLSYMPGDLIYIKEGQLHLYTNNVTKSLGYTELEYQRIIAKSNGLFFVDVEDREYVYNHAKKAIDEQSELNLFFKMNAKNGEKRYMQLRLMKTNGSHRDVQQYGILMEISKTVNMEQTISIAHQRIQYLLKYMNFYMFEYDYENDRMHIYTKEKEVHKHIASCEQKDKNTCVIEHFMERIRYMGDFTPEAYEVLSLLEKKIHTNDLNPVTLELTKYHTHPLQVRIECHGIYNETHTLIRLLGIMKDVTNIN